MATAPNYIGQMFEQALTALKGWPLPGILDIEGSLSSNVNINSTGLPALSGMCVHIESLTAPAAGKSGPNKVVFEMGAVGNDVALFLWPSSTDFDVQNRGVAPTIALGGDSTHVPGWIPGIPAGVLVALVALGGYELETDQFDTNQSYAPSDFLRAVTSNTNANAGKLTNQDASGGVGFATSSKAVWGNPAAATWETVVGRVSRGVYTNASGVSVLAFWPDSLPGVR